VGVRDEHWTRLGMDCNRTTANFVEFGLEPDYKSLKIEDQDQIWIELIENKRGIFVVKSCICQIFWTSFGLRIYI